MKQILSALILVFLIASCSKKDAVVSTTPPAVILPDTLSAGWTKIATPITSVANDVFFIDANTGFLSSQTGGIYKSVNGGLTWANTNAGSGANNIAMASPNRACFTNNQPAPMVTQDGGTSFLSTTYYAPGGAVDLIDCFYSSLNTCYMASGKYIWKSTNGGVLFDTVYNFQVSTTYASLFFLNDQTGWNLRAEGIYKTSDGGTTWTPQYSFASGAGYGAVQFVDTNTGFYVFSDAGNAAVYKSTNGGTSFVPVFSLPASTFYDIAFVSATTGFVSAANTVYKTTDAGATWNKVVSLGNENFVEIHFVDANHGWGCTTDGTLLRFNQ